MVVVLNFLPVFAVLRSGGFDGLFDLGYVVVLNSLISMVLVFRCFLESVRFLVFRDNSWVPMRVDVSGVDFWFLFKCLFVEEVVGTTMLIVSLVRGDYVGLLYFVPWIASFILSPFIFYYTSQKLDSPSRFVYA